MKIDLIGMIFAHAGRTPFDGIIIDDDGRELDAEQSLDATIMEYAKVRNGGQSDIVTARPTPKLAQSPDWTPIEGHEREAVAASHIIVRTVTVATYRYRLYKPDGARQMGKKGRWQILANEYGRWTNCQPPQESEWQPSPDMAKVAEGSAS